MRIGPSRFAAAALCALVLAALMLSGCANIPGFTRTPEGHLQHTQGDRTWVLARAGGQATLQLNGADFATIGGGRALFTLPGGRIATVTLDAQSQPEAISIPYGTLMDSHDYALINAALEVNALAGGVRKVPWAGIGLLLALLVLSILLQVFAPRLIDNAKRGGYASGQKTARTLLLLRALGALLTVISLVWLIGLLAA